MNIKRYYFYFLLTLFAFLSASTLTAWDNNERIFYHFTDYSNFNIIQFDNKNWNAESFLNYNSWQDRILSDDSLLALDSLISLSWRSSDSSWQLHDVSNYYYGEKGRQVQVNNRSRQAGKWMEEYFKTLFYYDENGNKIKSEIYNCSDATGNCTIGGKTIYEFDTNNRNISRISYNWKDSSWITLAKATYTYYESGKLKKQANFAYKNSNWDTTAFYEYTYDSLGRVIRCNSYDQYNTATPYSTIQYIFSSSPDGDTVNCIGQNLTDSGWVNASGSISIYNKDGLIIEYHGGAWQSYKTGLFKEFNRYFYEYNNKGLLTKESYQKLYLETYWVWSSIKYWDYDTDGNLTEYWYKDIGYSGDTILANRVKDIYIYKKISSVEDLISTASDINIYPNPASDFIEIPGAENGKAEIFNSLGSLVISSLGRDRIDISSLPAGVYYVKVGDMVRKIVKI